jgi:diguanylate cyclase (GGDEF)-like protein/PAS domain S-box-containing protein
VQQSESGPERDGARGFDAPDLPRSPGELEWLAATTPVGVFRSSLDTGNTFVSDQLAKIFGVAAERLLGRGWLEFVDPSDRNIVETEVEAVRSGHQPLMIEYRIARPDGLTRTVHVRAVPTFDLSGAVDGYVGSVEDISDRLFAEQDRQERERLAAALESTPDLVSFHDLEGRAFYLNRAAREFFGVREGEHPKPRDVRNYLDLTPEQANEIQAAIFGAGLWQGELIVRAPNGERRPASIVVVSHRDESGDVQYFSATTRDITERVAIEAALRERDERLRESEERYRTIVETQTDLVCRYLPDTTLTFVNPAFCAFYGGTPDDWLGRRLIEVFPTDDRARELGRLASFAPDAAVQIQQDWEPRHDGLVRWYEWTDTATFDDRGNPIEFQSVGRDNHEQYLSRQLTEHQAEILELIARGEPLETTLNAITRLVEAHERDIYCSIMLVTPDGEHLRVGASASLPASLIHSIGLVPVGPAAGSCGTAAYHREMVVCPDVATDPRWQGAYAALAAEYGLRSSFSTPLLCAERTDVLGTLAIYSTHVGAPSHARLRLVEMMARLAEIAIERKGFEDRLAHDSVHDPLTKLPNRTLFLDRLAQALGRARRSRRGVSVAFLDLDGFKVVNDGLGHEAGDELLVDVARRLEAAIRPGDTVARFGGDEFVVLCEELDDPGAEAQAVEIAQRLMDSLSHPFSVRETETFVGSSVGVALSQRGEDRAEDLLRDADAAMYEAKALGKQRVVLFDDALRDRALTQHATFNALHRAIDRDELRVFFQPLISLRTGDVLGAEALVRWQHPERGLVPPSEFIPLAEQSDLIERLGLWVLDQAVRFAAANQPERGSFSVSVNLAARQLAGDRLAERVGEVLQRHELPSDCLCLEITESVLMRDADATVGVIDQLQALGVRVSIDDFGTGYSSLAYLKRFPVDSVKIDRSFVDGLPDDPGDRAIVTAVVSLAHALGLDVVAEGVETAEQLAELVALGCDQAQGYYFAKPLQITDRSALLAETRRWAPSGVTPIRSAS